MASSTGPFGGRVSRKRCSHLTRAPQARRDHQTRLSRHSLNSHTHIILFSPPQTLTSSRAPHPPRPRFHSTGLEPALQHEPRATLSLRNAREFPVLRSPRSGEGDSI